MSKPTEQQRIQIYSDLCTLFEKTVPDADRFSVVYGVGMDVGLADLVVVRVHSYIYSSYAIGYDPNANEIVILPVDTALQNFGAPVYLKHDDIKKAKISGFSKEITIRDNSLPKKYIQFSVQEDIQKDPDDICICIKQDEEAKRFHAFFKSQYAK